MKKIIKNRILIIAIGCLALLVSSCDSTSSLDCVQKTGDLVTQEVIVPPFTKIVVYQRTQLIIEQGPVQSVLITTGENLINEIKTEVKDGQLIIKNENGCNLLRNYGETIVKITIPNLTEIRTSTGLDILSLGTLSFPTLTLLSEDSALEDEFNTDGDFRLDLAVNNLNIVSNNLSNFYLTGSAANVNFDFIDGDGTIKAENLIIQNADIRHRGTNSWKLDVKQNITGTISGYGDVYLKARPTAVSVNEIWRGKLIIGF